MQRAHKFIINYVIHADLSVKVALGQMRVIYIIVRWWWWWCEYLSPTQYKIYAVRWRRHGTFCADEERSALMIVSIRRASFFYINSVVNL